MYSDYGNKTYYQDSGQRRRKTSDLGDPGTTAHYSHGYDERQSKKARRDWDEPGSTAQFSRGHRGSGYTSSSTRYPRYLDDLDEANYSTLDEYSLGLQGSQSTSNLTSYQGLYSVPNIPKSQYNNRGELQGFSSSAGASSVLDLGRLGNKGSLGIMGGSRVDTVSQRLDQSNRFGSEFSHGSGLSLRQNYGGSRYSDMMMLDNGSFRQNQSLSGRSAAYAKPDFDENGISRLGIDANVSQMVGFDSLADIQEGIGYGRNYGEKDFVDRQHYRGSLQQGNRRQGQRSVFAQGKNESDLQTDLTLRMAAEIQQRKRGKVDVNKILKVMEIVDHMSEDVNPRFVEEERRGRMAKSGFDFSRHGHSVHEMRGSYRRQDRSSSHGGRMDVRKQRGGVDRRGEGSRMTQTRQRSLMRGNRMNVRDRRSGRNTAGQNVGEKTGQGMKRKKTSVETSDEKGKPKSHEDKDVRASERQIHNFMKFLKATEKGDGNAIRDIDLAVQRSRLGLKLDYQVDLSSTAGNFLMQSGRLFISGVFIARAAGRNKKLVKAECYEKALHLLKTQSAEVIMKQEDNKKDEVIKEKVEELDKIVKERAKLCENEDENEEECILEFRNKYRTLKDLLKFVNVAEDDVDDDIAALSDTITESGLDYTYSVEETETARGICWFIGNLKIGDILVGVGSGPSRRYAKRRTFTRALKFLKKCRSFMQLVDGLTETEDCLVPEFDLLHHVQSLPNDGTRNRLSVMINMLLKMPEGDVSKDIEEAAKSSKLVLSLLYKKGGRVDLFLDEIFISSGEAGKRQEAESQAYHEALTVLYSSSADVIFSDFKRMSNEDSKDLFEMLVVMPNEKRRIMYTSNEKRVASRKKSFSSLITEEDSEDIIDQDKIIIMENKKLSGDRYNKAFDILQQSAEWNCMILQKKVTRSEGETCCQIFLGHMKVAEASSQQSMEEASKQSSAKALFKLYQTRPTISMMRCGDVDEFPITYESMKAKADVLKEESGDTDDDDYIYITKQERRKDKSRSGEEQQMEENEEEENLNDGPTSTLAVNKWLKQVVEDMIEKFASEENLEEIVFDEGFPPGDKLQIQLTAKKYNLASRRFKANDAQFLVVYQKHLPAKILEILEDTDGHSGLFSIIPKEELPKPKDVESFRKPVEDKSTTSKKSTAKKATTARQSNQKGVGGKKSLYTQYRYGKRSMNR